MRNRADRPHWVPSCRFSCALQEFSPLLCGFYADDRIGAVARFIEPRKCTCESLGQSRAMMVSNRPTAGRQHAPQRIIAKLGVLGKRPESGLERTLRARPERSTARDRPFSMAASSQGLTPIWMPVQAACVRPCAAESSAVSQTSLTLSAHADDLALEVGPILDRFRNDEGQVRTESVLRNGNQACAVDWRL